MLTLARSLSRPAKRHVLLRRAFRRSQSIARLRALHRSRDYVSRSSNRSPSSATPRIGDRLETIAFNALPGTLYRRHVGPPVQPGAQPGRGSLHHKPWTTDGPESNLFGLEPNFGCCTANFHQGWPKFAASLWMASDDGGLAAVAYSPCEVHTMVAGHAVHLVEETDYPFRGTVRITVNPAPPLRFPVQLRIPAWATDASIRINGQARTNFTRSWQTLPASIASGSRRRRRADLPACSRGSRTASTILSPISRGPLVFSYPIGEDWVKLRNRGMTADWQVFPAPPGIMRSQSSEATSPACVWKRRRRRISLRAESNSVKLEVEARKLPTWRAIDGVADPVPQSPVTSDDPMETITLVPYAAAKLRITAFPQLKS